ncbi:hypothetical protein CU102_27375 [Phyllobacterium brassicacearum]|uniref:Uncharacterized protein n=1 Tax=Phyllobacterium brassicacearum TaxID=314235 RepID=A0A2P7B3F6_9HYPH|nr:hypothetical protein CU102_27375 [Phyllobacterium brassicacearum]
MFALACVTGFAGRPLTLEVLRGVACAMGANVCFVGNDLVAGQDLVYLCRIVGDASLRAPDAGPNRPATSAR